MNAWVVVNILDMQMERLILFFKQVFLVLVLMTQAFDQSNFKSNLLLFVVKALRRINLASFHKSSRHSTKFHPELLLNVLSTLNIQMQR